MQNHPIQNIFSHSMKCKENKTSLHFAIHKNNFLKLNSESIGENRALKAPSKRFPAWLTYLREINKILIVITADHHYNCSHNHQDAFSGLFLKENHELQKCVRVQEMLDPSLLYFSTPLCLQ